MDGEVAYCDFVKPADVEHPDYVKAISQYHYGPVIGLQRSPFFDDVLLSVGDWAFKVGVRNPAPAVSCLLYSFRRRLVRARSGNQEMPWMLAMHP
jgi:hypothetical protein